MVQFTARDDQYLVRYLATYYPHIEGREAEQPYQQLVQNGQKWPWGRRHTAHAWREHYDTCKSRLDMVIQEYQQTRGIETSPHEIKPEQIAAADPISIPSVLSRKRPRESTVLERDSVVSPPLNAPGDFETVLGKINSSIPSSPHHEVSDKGDSADETEVDLIIGETSGISFGTSKRKDSLESLYHQDNSSDLEHSKIAEFGTADSGRKYKVVENKYEREILSLSRVPFPSLPPIPSSSHTLRRRAKKRKCDSDEFGSPAPDAQSTPYEGSMARLPPKLVHGPFNNGFTDANGRAPFSNRFLRRKAKANDSASESEVQLPKPSLTASMLHGQKSTSNTAQTLKPRDGVQQKIPRLSVTFDVPHTPRQRITQIRSSAPSPQTLHDLPAKKVEPFDTNMSQVAPQSQDAAGSTSSTSPLESFPTLLQSRARPDPTGSTHANVLRGTRGQRRATETSRLFFTPISDNVSARSEGKDRINSTQQHAGQNRRKTFGGFNAPTSGLRLWPTVPVTRPSAAAFSRRRSDLSEVSRSLNEGGSISIAGLSVDPEDHENLLLEGVKATLSNLAQKYGFTQDVVYNVWVKSGVVAVTEEILLQMTKAAQRQAEASMEVYERSLRVDASINDEESSEDDTGGVFSATRAAMQPSRSRFGTRKGLARAAPAPAVRKDSVSFEYDPPWPTRAAGFNRLAEEGRLGVALERERRRASGQFVPLSSPSQRRDEERTTQSDFDEAETVRQTPPFLRSI